jgi:hypothetical protein
MHHVTIRNVDPLVKSALEARARADGVSQTEAARRALAQGLGVKVPRRSLGGIGEAVFDRRALEALGQVDWSEPAFSDDELDAMEREEARRSAPVPR